MEETIRKVSAIFDKMASVKITPTSNYSVPEYWMNRAIKGDEKCKDNLFNWISIRLNIDKSILNAVFNAKYNKTNENKVIDMKRRNRLTESDLHKIVKESVNRVLKEVALKGKSGKTYSLHGNDPESWAVMSRLRGKGGFNSTNTPQFYHASRDENNWIELDDKAHPNLRSRNNAKRIDAMLNRIDSKSKDIMAANESKLSRIVKESVKRVLKENQYFRGVYNGYYDMPEGSTIQDLANEIQKDFDEASKPFYSRWGGYQAGRQYRIDSYLRSMTKAIVNGFSKEDYLKALEAVDLYVHDENMENFDNQWQYCIKDLNDEVRRAHQAWAEDQMSDMGFGYEGD